MKKESTSEPIVPNYLVRVANMVSIFRDMSDFNRYAENDHAKSTDLLILGIVVRQ